jgi:hypothetical protein
MNIEKKLFLIGFIAYSCLLFLAYLFYQERTLWGDIAFHLFYLIKENAYTIQNQRFGAFLTQSIPLWGSRMGLSFYTITLCYSLIFVVYYFLVFFLSFKFFKNWKMGISMLLLSTLMVSDTFFWIQSEFPQGLAFMILFFALLTKSPHFKDFSKLELLFIPPMLVMISYFHPLIFIPFSFISIFIFLSKKPIANKKLLIASFLFCLFITILKQTVLKNDSTYEANAMAGLNNFIILFPDYFSIDYNFYFLQCLFTDYYFLVILLGLMTFFYVKEKLYLKLFLVWGFFVSYLLLVNISFCQAPFVQFYMENLYLPLSLFVIIPLTFDYLPSCTNKKQVFIIASIVSIGIIRISFSHTEYSTRINWEKKLLAETNDFKQKKLIIPANAVSKKILQDNAWSTPYDFWAISSIENPNNIRSVVIHATTEIFDYPRKYENKYFFTYWGHMGYHEFTNKTYFNFQDTSYYKIYRPQK